MPRQSYLLEPWTGFQHRELALQMHDDTGLLRKTQLSKAMKILFFGQTIPAAPLPLQALSCRPTQGHRTRVDAQARRSYVRGKQ